MKSVKICLIILLAAVLINWVREGDGFHISHVLPFMSGKPISFYDIGCIGLLCLLFWGIGRLKKNKRW